MSSTHRWSPVRSARRPLAVVLIALLTCLVGATSARAHDELLSTDPADGSTVPIAPDHVTLTFGEPAIALGTVVEVHAPDGSLVSAGEPQLVDEVVTQPLVAVLPAGLYSVQWRVTSADGHPITGAFSFTATAATVATAGTPVATVEPTVEPMPTASVTAGTEGGTDAGTGSTNGLRTGVLVASVLAVVGVVAWLLRRRRRSQE